MSNAPVVDLNGPEAGSNSQAQYVVRGGGPTRFASNALVTDSDSANFNGGTLVVRIGEGAQNGDLLIVEQGSGSDGLNVFGSDVSYFGASFATITYQNHEISVAFNANATPAAVQALLRRFGYTVTVADPINGDRHIDVTLTDGAGGVSSPVTSVVTVTGGAGTGGAAPTVTPSAATVTFVESTGETATQVQIDPGITVADSDSSTLASATIRIVGGYDPTQDVLGLPPSNPFFGNITASWDAATGTLTLTSAGATATLDQWRDTLRQVYFENGGDPPSGTSRTFSITVDDGGADSAAATRTMAVQAANDAPVADLNGGEAGIDVITPYLEQAPPTRIAPDAVVSDVDSANFDGGTLTVSYGAPTIGGDGAADVLAVLNEGSGPGQVGVSGSTISYGGVVIGSFTGGGANATALVVTFNAAADAAAVQAVLRAVTYYNPSDRPPHPGPSLEVRVTDGDGGTSVAANLYLNVAPVDDPVAIDLNGAAAGQGVTTHIAPGSIGAAVAPGAFVIDDDDQNFTGARLTVRLEGGMPGDVVGILDQGDGPGQISVHDGNVVTFEGSRIGTVQSGIVILDAQFVPVQAVQALVRAIGFANPDAVESSISRTLVFELTTQGSGTAITQSATIFIGSDTRIFESAISLAGDEFGANAAAGGWASQNDFPRLVADINGDGRGDIVGFGEAGTFVALGGADGSFGTMALAADGFGRADAAGGWASNDRYPRLLGDVNGDGRADIVGFGENGTLVALADGQGGFGDMFVATDQFGAGAGAGGWESRNLFSRSLGDVNGDGRLDIVGFGTAGTFVALGNGNGTFAALTLATDAFGRDASAGGWESHDLYPRMLADINGDRRADIVGFGSAATYVAYGNADGSFGAMGLLLEAFGADPQAGGWQSQDRHPRAAADLNGDGLADLIGFGEAGVYYGINNGAAGFGPMTLGLSAYAPDAGEWDSGDRNPRLLADVNGDGEADIVGFGDAGVYVTLATGSSAQTAQASSGAMGAEGAAAEGSPVLLVSLLSVEDGPSLQPLGEMGGSALGFMRSHAGLVQRAAFLREDAAENFGLIVDLPRDPDDLGASGAIF